MGKKKAERTWFIDKSLVTLSAVNLSDASVPVIAVPEGQVLTPVWANRVMGRFNVAVTNPVAGGERFLELWMGLALVDSELAQTGTNMLDGSDDNIAWLWRSPWRFFSVPTTMTAGRDFAVDERFDWPLRGGRGSRPDSGQGIYWVYTSSATCFALGCTDLKITNSWLTLYSAT